MIEKIAVGVVGVGHLGRHHARLYAGMPDVRLVAVADRDVARAKAVAAEYGCDAVASVSDLTGKVTAASVAVPTVHHLACASELLANGADVLVEKPIASSLREADNLIETARDRGRLLMVGHTLAGFTARSTDVDVILDLMIHDLDLLLHLDGSEPRSVDAVGVAALTDKVDIANARIRLASGCVANLTASRISADKLRRIRVFQSRTYLACDAVGRTAERFRLAFGPGGAPAIEHEALPVPEGEPLGLELRAFVDAVRTRAAPPVDGRAGRRALELAYRVRDAISEAAVRS